MDQFRDLLAEILPRNRFYARKYDGLELAPADFRSPEDLRRLPLTTKEELAADQRDHPPYGSNLTYPLRDYCRLHQTSGTSTGRPLRWLDTARSWEWMLGHWQHLFAVAGLGRDGDRFFFPFSFGPFLGFWTAFEAAARMGRLCLPGGGMSSAARLRFLLENQSTVVCCTPTYALHLLEVAEREGLDLRGSPVRAVVVAGEPGGSIPGARQRLEGGWGAEVVDHYGMTEIGPTAIETRPDVGGLCVNSHFYLAEVVEPHGTAPTPAGEVGELVLTNLGRRGSPLIRYRTGDLVRLQVAGCRLQIDSAAPAGPPGPVDRQSVSADQSAICNLQPAILLGGILGRADDMIHLRGNNVYPTAVEAVIRRFPEVAEFRIVVDQSGPLADLRIEVEPNGGGDHAALAEAVGRAVRDELLFRAEVTAVPPGSLPRFEMKARRIQRL